MKSKKAQMGGLENAPAIIMIVGLVFLTMATMALIGQKYGSALDTTTSGTVTNETGWVNSTSYTLTKASIRDFANPVITTIYNRSSGLVVPVSNATVTAAGVVTNTSVYGWDNASISYTYTYSETTVASNTTGDLETEISNNTSIAGIILTISLVGIVLTILIGVFIGLRKPRI